jgi:hypothetical protein
MHDGDDVPFHGGPSIGIDTLTCAELLLIPTRVEIDSSNTSPR